MKIAKFILLLSLFVAGCSKPATKWEYKTFELYNDNDQQVLKMYNSTLSPKDINNAVASLKESGGSFFQGDYAGCHQKMESLGADGWELVGIAPEIETTYPELDTKAYIRTEQVLFVFKRPLQ